MRVGVKTKVCHVIECGSLGGCGRMVASICAGLDPQLFDITVLYAVRPDSTPEEFQALFPHHIHMVFVPDMVRPIHPWRDIRAFWKLYRFFRFNRPDVVHAHSSKAGILARFAAWVTGVPRVFYSPHGYSFRMTDAFWIVRSFYFCIEFLASRIGFIVVNGPSDERWARKLVGTEKVLPYYNGIDISLLTPQYLEADHAALTVATCGRVTAAKNQAAFLRLSACLAKEFPAATFVWIGGGDESEIQTLLSEAKRMHVNGRFHLTGWLPQARAFQELNKADLVVHYSYWDVLPTAVLEAMALGKPVVGSVAADQIEHGITGFLARNEDELLRYTRELLNSHELRTFFGRQARQVVEEKYSLSRLITQLETAYRPPSVH